MINQKESKQVTIDSWLLKLLSRDMKIKNKKQKLTNKQQLEIKGKSKNSKKVKAMGNITPTIFHYPRNG